ncbi:hypothetical protein IEE94_11130 [Yimella sp. cx-573]|nr:hypothetical protein [Yimella sp. cx-573]
MTDLTPEMLDGIEARAKEANDMEGGAWPDTAEKVDATFCVSYPPDAAHIAGLDPGTVLALVAAARELESVTDEYDHAITKQGRLLTGVANALNGQPPELTTWGHHDLPELAEEAVNERDTLRATVARVEAMHVEVPPRGSRRFTYCIECGEDFPCCTVKALRGEDQ